MQNWLVLLGAYLIGSIPFGFLVVRLVAGADVRETGSGGTGATNVTRRAGKSAGLLTLLFDATKGAAAVALAAGALGTDDRFVPWIAGAGFAAIVGHCFPIWLGFRGGKGVATMIGVFLVLSPLALVLSLLIFFATVGLTRYVSLGSILATAALPFLVWLANDYEPYALDPVPVMRCAGVVALLVIFMHRENIRRLLAGTENKFK
jgi:glycerol-3-phosphate acyltransferase PlsY